MNPPWQPPQPKRFRPNEPPNSNRQWTNGPPPPGHHPHVHPSRAAQLPPPPPVAPYHQQHGPPPPNPAPYYPPRGAPQQHNQLPPPPHHYPPAHQPGPPSRSRNKSSDPRTASNRHGPPLPTHAHQQHGPHWNHHQMARAPPPMPMPHNIRTASHAQQAAANNDTSSILDVLHIGADENKNFSSFAVTLNQIYGSRNIDGLPFGSTRSSAIQFDGRIRSSPILSFLPQAIDTPSKKVRVYELAPLAATDKRSYDELVAFFTKNERCPVVDKEYTMGVLLYFVPPKLIFKKVDPKINNDPRLKNKNQRLRKKNKKGKDESSVKTNFVDLLKLATTGQIMKEDRVWMISITSTSKYLMYKQKMKDKEIEKKKQKTNARKDKIKKQAEDLSDIEISDDEDDDSDSDESSDGGTDDEDMLSDDERKNKVDDIIKSELIVALESLYKQIGQRLPVPFM